MRLLDHVDLRVRDLEAAVAFYASIAKALGFPHRFNGGEWVCFCSKPFPEIGEYLALTEDKAHVPSKVCYAFWAESKTKVDDVAAVLAQVRAPQLEGPEMYYRGHYAVYFEDTSGNRFEVCYREYTTQFDPRIPALTGGAKT